MKKIFLQLLMFAVAAGIFSSCKHRSVVNDGKMWALLYQQQAAEYRALCYQAYNLAKVRLTDTIKTKSDTPYAVVTDIDETVLNNSLYDAERAKEDSDWTSASWKRWTSEVKADTVPGALDFFKFAASQPNVTIFYVTNRGADERSATIDNLKKFHFPFADTLHVFCKTDKSSSKEKRRQMIRDQKFRIVLLLGDNLGDVDKVYDTPVTSADRQVAVKKQENLFGKKYIVLPNPAYNDWENALYHFKQGLTHIQKDSIINTDLQIDKH